MPLAEDGRRLSVSGGLLSSGTVYLGLHTAAPTEASPNEVSGGGYARVAILTTGWTIGNDGLATNAADVEFAAAGAAWGNITHAALWDAATGGNLLIQQAMTSPLNVSSGATVRFSAGALDIEYAVA